MFGISATLIAGVMLGVLLCYLVSVWNRKAEKKETERQEVRKQQYEADKLRHTRDHQLNHGRRVYNWLTEAIKKYEEYGIRIWKMEQNGQSFSIIIDRVVDSMPRPLPILQLSFDFVKFGAPWQGHIHYGAYGADILFWVGDHAPYVGLDRLVLAVVDAEAESAKASRTAAA